MDSGPGAFPLIWMVPVEGTRRPVGHFDQRRLAAAVGAQQTDDFSAPHMQFQLIQCPLGPVPFAQGGTSQ